MKRKFISILLSAVISSAITAAMTVSAEELPTETGIDLIPVETTETEISEIEPEISDKADFESLVGTALEKDNITVSESSEPDYYGDDLYDTNGNASLITSEHIIYNSEEMQFIAVTTKDGHVFYVLINYSAESGEDSVFFLNKVDDYDLYALLYANNDDDKNTITPEQAAQAAENANSRFPKKTDKSDSLELGTDTAENSDTAEDTPPKKSMNMTSIYLVGGVAVLGIIGFVIIKLLKKPKRKAEIPESDDDDINFYDEHEVNEDNE